MRKNRKNDTKWHKKDQIYVRKLMWYLNVNYSTFEMLKNAKKVKWDGRTDGRTDRRTDRPTWWLIGRVARDKNWFPYTNDIIGLFCPRRLEDKKGMRKAIRRTLQ